MDWSDMVTIGGVSLAATALALHFWQRLRLAGQVGRRETSFASAQRIGNVRQDLYLGVVWLVLIPIYTSQVFHQVQRGAAIQDIMLSLAAVMAGAFGCGLFVGRLLLRRQLHTQAIAEGQPE